MGRTQRRSCSRSRRHSRIKRRTRHVKRRQTRAKHGKSKRRHYKKHAMVVRRSTQKRGKRKGKRGGSNAFGWLDWVNDIYVDVTRVREAPPVRPVDQWRLMQEQARANEDSDSDEDDFDDEDEEESDSDDEIVTADDLTHVARANKSFVIVSLCANPNPKGIQMAMRMDPQILDQMRANPNSSTEYMTIGVLNKNPNALHILQENPQFIRWFDIWTNPNPQVIQLAMQVAEQQNKPIRWDILSRNAGANQWLLQHPNHIDYPDLCANQSPEAAQLVRQALQDGRLQWSDVIDQGSKNPYLEDILLSPEGRSELHKRGRREWENLSSNPSRKVAEFLYREHPDRINISNWLENPVIDTIVSDQDIREYLYQGFQRIQNFALSHLLKNPNNQMLEKGHQYYLEYQRQDQIQHATVPMPFITSLFVNPAIFEGFDYHVFNTFKANDYKQWAHDRIVNSGLASDLMANRFNIKNKDKWLGWGQEDEGDFADMVDTDANANADANAITGVKRGRDDNNGDDHYNKQARW